MHAALSAFIHTDGFCLNCVAVATYDSVIMWSQILMPQVSNYEHCVYRDAMFVVRNFFSIVYTPIVVVRFWGGCTENFGGVYNPSMGGVSNSLPTASRRHA